VWRCACCRSASSPIWQAPTTPTSPLKLSNNAHSDGMGKQGNIRDKHASRRPACRRLQLLDRAHLARSYGALWHIMTACQKKTLRGAKNMPSRMDTLADQGGEKERETKSKEKKSISADDCDRSWSATREKLFLWQPKPHGLGGAGQGFHPCPSTR